MPTLSQYFSPDWIIERSACNSYSQIVCNKFNRLIENKESTVIDSIATSLKPITSDVICYPETKTIKSLIVEFILTLKERNLLPCIVFSDHRLLCENMAESVAEYFQLLEEDLRKTKYKNQIEELEKRLKLQQKNKPRKVSKRSQRRNKDDDDDNDHDNDDELRMGEEISGLEYQLLHGILDEGTLANRYGCDRKIVDSLLERAAQQNPRLVSYMQRGVAYHHAGVNNKGRVAVEALFRSRYIQVVFSTSTLGKC